MKCVYEIQILIFKSRKYEMKYIYEILIFQSGKYENEAGLYRYKIS